MLALLPPFPALLCSALLRTGSTDQCCLSYLDWLLCHQDGPGSLRSSSHGTILPVHPGIFVMLLAFQERAPVVGEHGVAIVLLPASVDIFHLAVAHLHGCCRYQALRTAVIVF